MSPDPFGPGWAEFHAARTRFLRGLRADADARAGARVRSGRPVVPLAPASRPGPREAVLVAAAALVPPDRDPVRR